MTARRPKDVSAWLGGNRGTVQSGSSNEIQIDTGGGEKDAVNSTLALGLAGAAGLTAAGVALRRSGVGTRILNKVQGQEIYLHGSPTTGLKEIRPMGNSTGSRLAFFENPKDRSFGDSPGILSSRYAIPKGSVYVVKGPKNSFKPDVELSSIAISKQSQRVVSEIKLANIGSDIDVIKPIINKTLRKAGYKAPKKR